MHNQVIVVIIYLTAQLHHVQGGKKTFDDVLVPSGGWWGGHAGKPSWLSARLDFVFIYGFSQNKKFPGPGWTAVRHQGWAEPKKTLRAG